MTVPNHWYKYLLSTTGILFIIMLILGFIPVAVHYYPLYDFKNPFLVGQSANDPSYRHLSRWFFITFDILFPMVIASFWTTAIRIYKNKIAHQNTGKRSLYEAGVLIAFAAIMVGYCALGIYLVERSFEVIYIRFG